MTLKAASLYFTINHIDFSHLRKISKGDFNFEKGMINSFLTSSEQYLQELNTYNTEADIPHLQNATSDLKSACQNMGTDMLYQKCELLAHKCKEGNLDRVSKLIEEINLEFSTVSNYLHGYLISIPQEKEELQAGK